MGRGRLVWILCLSALLAGFVGAQVNPVALLLVGVLTPLPVLLAGWRSGKLAALALALAAAVLIFCLHPTLDTFWQNLGFMNLLAMGVVLASLQCRGIWAPQAIIYTVVALSVPCDADVSGAGVLPGSDSPGVAGSKDRRDHGQPLPRSWEIPAAPRAPWFRAWPRLTCKSCWNASCRG